MVEARYLRRAPIFSWHYTLKKEPTQIIGYSDSDWAGDLETRKSTSGGVITLEAEGDVNTETTVAAVQAWSRSQGPIALSSMEAEYYALITACQETRAIQSLIEEITGKKIQITLCTDSNAARMAVEKRGTLHCKHMQIRHLFLKELQDRGVVKLTRVASKANPADLLTKILSQQRIEEIILSMAACWSVRGFMHD